VLFHYKLFTHKELKLIKLKKNIGTDFPPISFSRFVLSGNWQLCSYIQSRDQLLSDSTTTVVKIAQIRNPHYSCNINSHFYVQTVTFFLILQYVYTCCQTSLYFLLAYRRKCAPTTECLKNSFCFTHLHLN